MWDKPTLLNWIANLLFALSVVAMLYAALYAVVHLPIFPLREVKIDGQLNHVSREQVKLIVGKHLKGNFFTLDLTKARDAFEKLPWARNVSLRRRWPDQLEVVVEEHQELARWGSIALVNIHGELFHAATNSELPMFYGPGDGVADVASQYVVLSTALSKAHLKIASLTLTTRRAWQITTSSGMLIELGRVEMQPRIEKFANVYVSTIAGLNKKIDYADLRYPNGFAVRRPAVDIAKEKQLNSHKSIGMGKQTPSKAKLIEKPKVKTNTQAADTSKQT
ncbi:MAG: cell division protein FtsQ/DivIB [Methylotenera sp.]